MANGDINVTSRGVRKVSPGLVRLHHGPSGICDFANSDPPDQLKRHLKSTHKDDGSILSTSPEIDQFAISYGLIA